MGQTAYTRAEIIAAIMSDELDGAIRCVDGRYYPITAEELIDQMREHGGEYATVSDYQRAHLHLLPADVIDHWMEGWVDPTTRKGEMLHDYREEIVAIAERVCPPRFGMQDDWNQALFTGAPAIIDASEAIATAEWLEGEAPVEWDAEREDDYAEIARQIRELVSRTESK